MVKVRTAKNKGSSFEYDCLESLQQALPNAYLTKQRGFQLQYDIQDDASKCVWECKRLRGISWNALDKFYQKLLKVAPKGYKCAVLFQSNHQPCLVFTSDSVWGCLSIKTFIDEYNVSFKKHTPIKRGRFNEQAKDLASKNAMEVAAEEQEEYEEDPE
jgi:hypothetical protein